MKNIRAFTLVELAIVMTIIGLLIGGILKGQELLENARVTATIAQIKSYDAAVISFRDIYSGLPGDFRFPNRIPQCTNDPCSRPGDGNETVYLRWGTTAVGGSSLTVDMAPELYTFWLHLGAANLISGIDYTTTKTTIDQYGEILPAAKLGGGFNIGDFGWTTASGNGLQANGGLFLILTKRAPALYTTTTGANGDGFSPLRMYMIDQKIDDGKPTTGSVVNYVAAGCATGDHKEYDVSSTTCPPLLIRINR